MENRVIFVNLTKLCNVNCPRCYLTAENRLNKQRLPLDSLEKLLDSNYVKNADDVVVIFQGGEPSILGYDALKDYSDVVRRIAPTAKMAMVSNLLNMPDWLIDYSKNILEGRLETTYASGHKFTLSGSSDGYNDKFLKSLTKAIANGLECPINVELNRETYERGPQYLVDIAIEAKARIWEFDFSVDFAEFHSRPAYSLFGYPVVSSTLTYDEFYEFVFDFQRLFNDQTGMELSCGVVNQFKNNQESINFNIQREKDFITINPDGSITTNPLFSDIVPTYLGNINSAPLDDIVCSVLRIRRILHEKKRIEKCYQCPHFNLCGGGVSHLPVFDGGANCIGGIQWWKLNEQTN